MSPNSRTAAQVRREMERLQLRLRRREISPAMYNRLCDKLIQELNGITPMPSEYSSDAVRYATKMMNNQINREKSSVSWSFERDGWIVPGVDGLEISTSTSTRELTAEEWARFREAQARTIQMTGIFDWGSGSMFFAGPDPKSVAEQAWEEHGGVVMCECENLNCELVIDITKEEYLHASTPGYRRLTHPNCGYGIVNSKLVGRSEKWNIWDKGR